MGTGTLGKATIQSIMLWKNDDKNVKISINKFYRYWKKQSSYRNHPKCYGSGHL
jgi:hypothetical protein